MIIFLKCLSFLFQSSGASEVYDNGYFGPATSDFFMDNINCDGTEDNLMYCEHGGFLVSDCIANETAGVACDPIREFVKYYVGFSLFY